MFHHERMNGDVPSQGVENHFTDGIDLIGVGMLQLLLPFVLIGFFQYMLKKVQLTSHARRCHLFFFYDELNEEFRLTSRRSTVFIDGGNGIGVSHPRNLSSCCPLTVFLLQHFQSTP